MSFLFGKTIDPAEFQKLIDNMAALQQQLNSLNAWAVTTQNTITTLIANNNKNLPDIKAHSAAIDLLKTRMAAMEAKNVEQDAKDAQIDAALEGIKKLGQSVTEAEQETATEEITLGAIEE